MSRVQPTVLGYIVTSRERRGAYQIGFYNDGPPAGILLVGDCATVFTTENKAYAAIRRTKRYEMKLGCDWDTGAMRVQRAIAQKRA